MHDLTSRAKKLRANSTDAERLLWSHVRAHRAKGYKFKRQQQIGCFIVDFVCFEARLVIELDGGQRAEKKLKDEVRDRELERQSYRVLRFWNNEVLGNIEGVMQRIEDSQPPSPQPSPINGEG